VTALNVARVAALIALLGFVFPWVLVSCAGEPVGRLSGIDLATGGLTAPSSTSGGLPHGHPNLWVLLSLAAVIGAIIAGFLARGRRSIVAVLAASLIALAASGIGVASISSSAGDAPLRSQPAAAGSEAGQINLQYGYFITVAGLVGAIGACAAALVGRRAGAVDTPG
jgi:hypothetical protein